MVRFMLHAHRDHRSIDMNSDRRETSQMTHDPRKPLSRNDLAQLGAPGLRTFLAIAQLWGLDGRHQLQVLGSPDPAAYSDWCATAEQHRPLVMDGSALERIGTVLAIHAALEQLYTSENECARWIHGRHAAPPFNGRAPVDLLTDEALDGPALVLSHVNAAAYTGLYMAPNALDRAGEFQKYTEADVHIVEADPASP